MRRGSVPIFVLAGLMILVLTTRASAIDWSRVTFNGYTSLEFEQQIEEGEESGRGDTNASFDAKEFAMVLNVQLHDNVRVAANLLWEHGTATETDWGNIELVYGFVEYSFSDLFRVQGGKIATPFGISNEIYTAKIAFLSVVEPASITKPDFIIKSAFRPFPRKGAGLEFKGEGDLGSKPWDYAILVANGDQAEENPYEKDESSSKLVAARVRFEPMESLRVGGSYYHDRFSDLNTTFRSKQASGLEFEYNQGKFQVLAEIALSSRENADGSKKEQLGCYVQPSYRFGNRVTPYIRYDWLDPNRKVSDDRGADLVVGVNYEMRPGFMVRIENNWVKGQRHSELARFPGRDYNEIKAAIVAGW